MASALRSSDAYNLDRTHLFCADHTSFFRWVYWLAEPKVTQWWCGIP
jgi:hypothetical protein